MTLSSGRDAHYEVTARVDGGPVDFIVDTGATLVILRESDAGRIGIRPSRADYTATVSTANGKIKAAPATLDRVELGGITVYDVQGAGAAGRGAVAQSARHVVPVAAQALRSGQWPHGAGAVARNRSPYFGPLCPPSCVRLLIAPPHLDFEDLMFPIPKSALTPNTYAYESSPLVKPTGFREYDARWLLGKRNQPDGHPGAGHGPRHA